MIKFLGRQIDSRWRITQFDSPNAYGFKTIEGPIPFRGNLRFEPTDNGGTELTMGFEAEFGGFFKLAEGLVGKQVKKELENNLSALKILLEADPD